MDQLSLDQNVSLQVRRLIPAPRERVFRAWIERDALQQWFRPWGNEVIVSQLDVQVGGVFQLAAQTPDGIRNVVTGRYLVVRVPEKLVFTWTSSITNDIETVVTIELVEQGSSTEVILTHDRFASAATVARHLQGWTSVLDRLTSAVSG
jgi:uncharacterized protein YndB with AHSA1/START domain